MLFVMKIKYKMTTEALEKLIASNPRIKMKIRAYEIATGKSIPPDKLEKMILLLSK